MMNQASSKSVVMLLTQGFLPSPQPRGRHRKQIANVCMTLVPFRTEIWHCCYGAAFLTPAQLQQAWICFSAFKDTNALNWNSFIPGNMQHSFFSSAYLLLPCPFCKKYVCRVAKEVWGGVVVRQRVMSTTKTCAGKIEKYHFHLQDTITSISKHKGYVC